MKLDRTKIRKGRMKDLDDDGYVQAEKNELLSMMWEITSDCWAFVRGQDAEQRLQRNVATIIRRTG